MKKIIIASAIGSVIYVISCGVNDPSHATYPWIPPYNYTIQPMDAGSDAHDAKVIDLTDQ